MEFRALTGFMYLLNALAIVAQWPVSILVGLCMNARRCLILAACLLAYLLDPLLDPFLAIRLLPSLLIRLLTRLFHLLIKVFVDKRVNVAIHHFSGVPDF